MQLVETSDRPTSNGPLVVAGGIVAVSVFNNRESVDDIIARMQRTARAEAAKHDISTAEGRAALASIAYKVSRSKTAIDDLGKELVADLKAQTGTVDAERRRIREACDALRDEVRQPLTEWEQADERRRHEHELGIARLQSLQQNTGEQTSEFLQQALDTLVDFFNGRQWEEFAARAAAAAEASRLNLEGQIERAKHREAERAELERLRQEAAERETRERARLAAERAEKAERERQVREQQIAREAEERARREEQERAQREAKEAEERIEAERQRVRKAEQLFAVAEEARRRQQQEAAEREQRARDQATAAERQRAADAAAEEARQEAERAQKKRHVRKINGDAVLALISEVGVTREGADAIVQAIAGGKIPHISIRY